MGYLLLRMRIGALAMLLGFSATALAAEDAPETLAWFEPDVPHAGLQVRHAPSYRDAEAIVLTCEPRDLGEAAVLTLVFVDPDGATVFEAQAQVNGERPGPLEFTCPTARIDVGAYDVRIRLEGLSGEPIAQHRLMLRKVSRVALEAEIDAIELDAGALAAHVATLGGPGVRPARPAIRTAAAQLANALARRALDSGDLRAAYNAVPRVRGALDAVRAWLAFAPENAEPNAAVPEADLATLTIRDGAFFAQGPGGAQPVFPIGLRGATFEALRRYGFDLAALDAPLSKNLPEPGAPATVERDLGDFLDRARENNVAVIVSADPGDLPDWAAREWPDLLEGDNGSFAFNPLDATALDLIERYIQTLASELDKHSMPKLLSLAWKPKFHFSGPAIRDDFVGEMCAIYLNRTTINTVWQSRLARLADIDIWDEAAEPAYQFDWQTHHARIGSEFLVWMRDVARAAGGGTALCATLDGDVFDPGEARAGLDRERLAPRWDANACATQTDPRHPDYAMDWAPAAMAYVLLRSIAPDKPVIDTDNRFVPIDAAPEHAEEYANSLMWQAVLSGLSASVSPWDDALAAQPGAIEGYAIAALDINRLAPVVVAFQRARAPVAILWSRSSKIYHDGEPYLASLRHAFEGCAFSGRKLRFVSEGQCAGGALDDVGVLVIPRTPALTEAAFDAVSRYVARGGVVIRVGMPLTFDEHGRGRRETIPNSLATVLVRGTDTPTKYLHAMDAATYSGVLDPIPRAVNRYGYPLEGVRTRHVVVDGRDYVYILNLRKTPVTCHLTGTSRKGRDLIRGRDLAFPCTLEPLDPMLVLLDAPDVTDNTPTETE